MTRDRELTNEEQLAALRANVDQAKAAAPELAATMTSYFHALVDQGLTRDEALQLTLAMQSAMFALSGLGAMLRGGDEGG